MPKSKVVITTLICLLTPGSFFAAPALTEPTAAPGPLATLLGFDDPAPTPAAFQIPVNEPASGAMNPIDLARVQLSAATSWLAGSAGRDGISTVAAVGLDASALVNPMAGRFVYHDPGQGGSASAFRGGGIGGAAASPPPAAAGAIASGGGGGSPRSAADQFSLLDDENADDPDSANTPGANGETGAVPTADAVSAVPEPSTWAMLIVGFGAVGLVARRRQRPRVVLS